MHSSEHWVQATPCVSGPSAGAMGVHFVLPGRVGDGVLKADEPEALIYEPMPSGQLRQPGCAVTRARGTSTHMLARVA